MALTQTNEEGLNVSNAGSNGQFLQKQSGNTGGLTWADAADADKIEELNTSVECIDTGTDGNIRFTTDGAEIVRMDSAIFIADGAPIRLGDITGTYTNSLQLVGNSSAAHNISSGYRDINVTVGGVNNNSSTEHTLAKFIHSPGAGTTDTKVELYAKNTKALTTNEDGVTIGDGSGAGKVSSEGAHDLVLETNKGTNSGNITITDAANGAITIAPNGTGDVVIDGLKYPQADGSAGQFLKTDGSAQLSWAAVSTQDTLSFRNNLHNGEFKIKQRPDLTYTGSGAKTCFDRWRINSGSYGVNVLVHEGAAPTQLGFNNAVRLNNNTAQTPGASDLIHYSTALEGIDCQNFKFGDSDAEDLTLSFWARSGGTGGAGQYGIQLMITDASNSGHQCNGKFDATNTWARHSITFPGTGSVTSNAIKSSTDACFYLYICLAAGSNFLSGSGTNTWAAGGSHVWPTGQHNFLGSTSSDLYLTGIQLETGSTATAYEHRTFGDELLRCQRYYEKSYPYNIAPGAAGDNGRRLRRVCASATNQTVFTNEQFQVRKRTTPTITTYSNDGTSGKVLLTNYGSTSIHANSSVYGACDYGFEVSGADTANGIGLFWEASAEI